MGGVTNLVRRCLALLAGVLLALTVAACGSASDSSTRAGRAGTAASSGASDPASGLSWINESALPAQAAHTLAEIRQGGPYDYPRNDNVVYHNNNGVLPHHRDGYYHEYTVRTPGSRTRGPRRIVTGSDGEMYWTADHYNHFARIREGT